MSALQSKRILLLEDEVLVAMMAEDILTDLGAVVVGPADTVTGGLTLVESSEIDAALLDINMNGERSYPVAEALLARRIPFVFCTGYGEDGWERASRVPIVSKPYTEDGVAAALIRAMDLSS